MSSRQQATLQRLPVTHRIVENGTTSERFSLFGRAPETMAFCQNLPATSRINPFSTADWAGVGVEPDVKVKAADAWEAAQKLAESNLRKK